MAATLRQPLLRNRSKREASSEISLLPFMFDCNRSERGLGRCD